MSFGACWSPRIGLLCWTSSIQLLSSVPACSHNRKSFSIWRWRKNIIPLLDFCCLRHRFLTAKSFESFQSLTRKRKMQTNMELISKCRFLHCLQSCPTLFTIGTHICPSNVDSVPLVQTLNNNNTAFIKLVLIEWMIHWHRWCKLIGTDLKRLSVVISKTQDIMTH